MEIYSYSMLHVSLFLYLSCGISYGSIVQLKCDGTRWRNGGEVKGKLGNGVGS